MFKNPDDTALCALLAETKTIALVGASANSSRPAFYVGEFMRAHGYTVIGVNPSLAGQELYGNPVYASLAHIPHPIDLVDIFRNTEAAGGVVDEALRLSPLPKAIWLQIGVVNEDAALKARQAGVTVVMDRCPKIEIARLKSSL